MSFFVYHLHGNCERDPALSSFPALLDELDTRLEDEEHTSVSVIHESEWCVGIYRGGYVVFENVETDDTPRHMTDVPRGKVIQLMEAIALGDLANLELEPWKPGY
jgi:hypothetical protein